MSLIFDKFASRERAESFVAQVEMKFGLAGQVFDDQESAMAHDPFPWVLDPPIVHIDRPDLDDPAEIEDAVAELVSFFGGVFAGT